MGKPSSTTRLVVSSSSTSTALIGAAALLLLTYGTHGGWSTPLSLSSVLLTLPPALPPPLPPRYSSCVSSYPRDNAPFGVLPWGPEKKHNSARAWRGHDGAAPASAGAH
eukprot:scaffold6967_cov123-Isochrysis_galbana.AAC.11